MQIRVTATIGLGEPTVDDGFISWLSVEILRDKDDERGIKREVIGTATVALIHAGEAGDDLYEALDAVSSDLEALYSLYLEDKRWAKFTHGKGSDVVYIQEITLEPGWQDRNIDFAVVRRLADTLGSGAELVVVPFKTDDESTHWQRMGFEVTCKPTDGYPGWLHMSLAVVRPRIVESDDFERFKVAPNPAFIQGTHH